MATRGVEPDLAQAAHDLQSIEGEASTLLDELAHALSLSSPAPDLQERAAGLAHEASRLARALSADDELSLNEQLVRLGALQAQADDLAEHLAHATLSAEHRHWARELEDVVDSVQAARASLRTLASNASPDRAGHAGRLRSSLRHARGRLDLLRAGFHPAARARRHPLHGRLSRVKAALAGLHAHAQALHQRQRHRRLGPLSQALGAEMRGFMGRELNGRFHVDSGTIQLRSDLNGRVQEWPHDDAGALALDSLLSGTDLAALLPKVRGRRATLAGKFECAPGADTLVAHLRGGERTIVGDTVVFKPYIVRINL